MFSGAPRPEWERFCWVVGFSGWDIVDLYVWIISPEMYNAYMERGCHMSEEGLDRFTNFVWNAFRDEVRKIKNQKETVKPKEANPTGILQRNSIGK